MSWSSSVAGVLAGSVGLACSPDPQIVMPASMAPARPVVASIDPRDGRVKAGHGRPEPAALTVEQRGAGPVRLRLTPRGGFVALSVVYVDRDAGDKVPLRLASSAVVPGRAETLGRLEMIDVQAASCAVTAGRLEPVLHAFAGPGPVLR